MALLMLPASAISALAADGATLTVENVNALPGSTVDVALKISDNPGIASMGLTLTFDEDLTLVGASNGEAFSEMTLTPPAQLKKGGSVTGSCRFAWLGNSNATENGIILHLTFEVAEDAQLNKDCAISVTCAKSDVLDERRESVNVSISNGKITVIDYMPGDIDGDGSINMLDVLTLCQYYVDGCKYDPNGYGVSIQPERGDVDANGVINMLDVLMICQYYVDGCKYDPNGYGVKLLPGKTPCDHSLKKTEAVAPTCTEAGHDAYWYCSKCERYFNSESALVEIELADTVREALGHNVVTVPGYPATKTKTGLTDGKACDRPGCDYVEVKQEVIPVISGYSITYEIANSDDYIEKHKPVIPADKMQYFSDTGLDLPQLKMPGYRFVGWSYSQASTNIVTRIPVGETGNKTLYAHWQIIEYTVTFDSPDIPVESLTYTVDKGATLKNPVCFGYTFVGWSNDDGFIVNRIKPGTTGHITLHANWTSDRNKATSYQSYGKPIIIEDAAKGQILFVYNIGRIDNVPLNEVEFIGKTETLNYKKNISVTDKVDETYVDNINKMISEATTKSSGWTLSKEWNDIFSTQEEVGNLTEKSDERTTSEGKTVGGKYFVSNSQGGSTHVSSESGSSSSNSAKVTTGNSVGINSSYDHTTEKYVDAKLGISNSLETSAGVEVPVKIAKVSAGVKNTTTIDAEVKSGRKDTDAYHIDNSISTSVGTERSRDTSAFFNSSVSNSSNWNSTSSYEQSMETSRNDSVTAAIKEQISKTTTHNLSKALGEVNSETAEKQEQQMSSEEYSTSFSYNKGTQTTTEKSFEFNSSEAGYYRIITAGTVHVYGVVGYDVATSSYFTYCYNVLDNTTREILDYSKDNMNFNDCENGVVTFEVPYEVNEYVAGFVGKTDGLEISYEGIVTGFSPAENFNGTVVIPQYESKDNKDGSFSAVRVTSFAASAFAGNKNIETVVLPVYITEIPDGAFAGCTNLKTVIAYGVTKIGANAFSGCTSLDKFNIDNAVTSLGENAFKDVPEISVTAYNSAVADAAIASGAKKVSVSIAYSADAYENKEINVGSDMEYFALIGNGGSYKNLQIRSDATETMISNMTFVQNKDNPLKFSSQKVTLARVSVENSPAFALVLTADQVDLDILGTVSLSANVENTVLSKNVTLNAADQSTTSKLIVNGKYLVCGNVVNKSYLNVEPTQITAEQFNSYLVSSIVTFNANGGSVGQTSKIVYKGQSYGTLPTPEKQYHAFKGWYTSPEGGTKITESDLVKTTGNQTLYAQWEVIAATIRFDTNGGGALTESTKTVYFGSTYGDLPAPSREHYTFDGWYTSAAGGTKVEKTTRFDETSATTLYAHWKLIPYTVSWKEGTGYTIQVTRTASPNAGAGPRVLSNGATVYYGDVLSVTYTANTGYSLGSTGGSSYTVTRNITASDIYASATLNSYTYNIVYKSSNGTALGSTTATYKYGTTNTISAPAKSGYNTPSAQSVKWDSTSAKTIVFTYSPAAVSNATKTGTLCSAPVVTYSARIEYANRTASSVQVRVIWTSTIAAHNYDAYGQKFTATIGSTSKTATINSYGTWTNAVSYDRSSTGTTDWITVSLGTTAATSVRLGINYYQVNSNGTNMTQYYNAYGYTGTWTVNIPAY